MSIYGTYYDIEPFNLEISVLINLQKIATVLQIKIDEKTQINHIYESIETSLRKIDKPISQPSDYHFVFVNLNGDEEQLFYEDWTKLVQDLEVFTNKFRVSFSTNDVEYNRLFFTLKFEQTLGSLDPNRYKLEKIIGVKEDYMTMVVPKSELEEFERVSRDIFLHQQEKYERMSIEDKLISEHPVIMNPKNVYSDFNAKNITLKICFNNLRAPNQADILMKIEVKSSYTVTEAMQYVLDKFRERLNFEFEVSDCLFRVPGRQEFLVPAKCKLLEFKYITDCIRDITVPSLDIVVRISNKLENRPSRRLHVRNTDITKCNRNSYQHNLADADFIYVNDLWKYYGGHSSFLLMCNDVVEVGNTNLRYNEPAHGTAITTTPGPKLSPSATNNGDVLCLSRSGEPDVQIDNQEDMLYSVRIVALDLPPLFSFVNKDQKIVIMAGVYHGNNSLCENQYKEWAGDSFIDLLFPIAIWNLPRMARLCFSLMIVKSTVKEYNNSSQKKPIGWGNLMIYDYQAVLRVETVKHRLWNSTKPNLNPIGSVYSNPDGELITPLLTINLLPKLERIKKIVYPTMEILIEEASAFIGNNPWSISPTEEERLKIENILARSPMDDVMEDEQEIIWTYRYYIRDQYQDALPKILISRPWNKFVTIAKMQHIARGWPVENNVVIALEMLGSDYPDSDMRYLAVNSLANMPWYDFSLYLLQICQCLKYESYLNSNLSCMLIKRMAENAKIAQSMFYYLKVEMSECAWTRVPFSIILYNYLNYVSSQSHIFIQQYHVTTELCLHNRRLKQLNNLDGERKSEARAEFQTAINNQNLFNDLLCPLDINIQLKKLEADKCKFMDSKMRPLRLRWCIDSTFKKTYELIYKNGDDLRQDALIVQMMHIMDSIWHKSGIDLLLNPYEVLACGKSEGYIEVVQNSETIANINKSQNNCLSWLIKNSIKTQDVYTENFRRSCAAYCVATFILGIGDRHNDNIMISDTGHLFHIDFGHILGNFKKIIGGRVRREYTKFILVPDFLMVVGKGRPRHSPEYQKSVDDFKQLCCDGYLTLRSKSNLILSLFMMMLTAELPELSSIDDLNYLKDTLQIGKSEDEARNYFNSEYDNTLRKAPLIALNWKAHEVKRNNN